MNKLGVLRDDHDPNNTYEGDNNVLVQQTSNYLLSMYREVLNGNAVSSPLESINFLSDAKKILTEKFSIKTDKVPLFLFSRERHERKQTNKNITRSCHRNGWTPRYLCVSTIGWCPTRWLRASSIMTS